MEIPRIDDGRSQCTNSFIEVQPSCRAFFFQLRKRDREKQRGRERESDEERGEGSAGGGRS